MSNLLSETLDKLVSIDKTSDDILYIGSSCSTYSCTWKEYVALANHDYNSGYGTAEVANDLVIIFHDLTRLERNEYDGSEWWSYIHLIDINTPGKHIHTLFGDTLSSLNCPT